MTVTLKQRKSGIILLFLIHGLVEATWVSRIPQIRDKLHAETGALGLALLGSALGAIISMPMTGWLLARFEGRRILLISSFLWCAALPLMGFASNLPMLMGALIIYGMAGGAMDIAMNAFGSVVDRESARPIMSLFHGMFSGGAMAGGAIGVLVVRMGTGILPHFLIASLLLALLVMATAPLFPRTPPEPRTAKAAFSMPARALLALGTLAFCILFGERAMADWTGIYLVQRGASDAYAAAGFTTFSAAMTAGRFAGDWLIHRFGPAPVLQTGSGVAAVGLAAALVLGTPLAGLVGFALVGAGFAVVVPILYRAAGTVPNVGAGAAIATVSTMGYTGFFVGPPLVGFVAQAISLRWALLIVALFSGLVCFGARRALQVR